ncbi:angiotensin-converting enzyme-like [Venturia canescens]|uniref:angiotensin-converting enzyme-like n=1 Tax=Venturia canescens TaxID=32260 RepID=UPI001C9BD599|nr:angiotensin-converting enzyme-like [Venturia canescens]
MIFILVGLLTLSSFAKCENATDVLADDPAFLARAKELLARLNREHGEWINKQTKASWAYASNLTDENLTAQQNVSAQYANHVRKMWQEVKDFNWTNIVDYDTRRQFEKLATPGSAALPEAKHEEFGAVISKMQKTYSTAKICDFKQPTKCDLSLEPEITELLVNSHDPEELKHLWIKWRDATGKKVKTDFTRYVELSNEIARLNGFDDMAAYWLRDYEADDFVQQIETLWTELKPLYLQLHAYVRRQLRLKYGEDIVSKDGPIPAHLLGNMWAQTWGEIIEFSTPYPGKKLPEVTEAMIQQGYNATSMFRLAENFFVSVNLSGMPELFWENSILEKQQGIDMICHASAWDFYDGKDFRIKQCTRVNMADLATAHHEMGHVQYYLQYKNQPTVYREGANPGFHEAVGDTISLSASTPGHLKNLGLLDEVSSDNEAVLNHLYFVGLDKISFLPFAFMMDKWRWGVFQGQTRPETYNCDWWSLAEEYQGIEPPVDRSEDDFDPGSKYHIIADVEYIRYYVSFVIQFQFHKALCTEAGEYDPKNSTSKPLSECNIYGSQKAGQLFKSMLELGSSRPWQDAMEKITGQRKMDSSGLLEYFQPLADWLKLENEKTTEYIGWKPSKRTCTPKMEAVAKNATVLQ